MSIDYQVVEEQGALINASFPYSRIFLSANRLAGDTAYLTINALTGYDTFHASEAAQVVINGVVVGNVWPTFATPAADDPYLGAEITIPFQNSILAPNVVFFPGLNVLQIVPQGDTNDPNNYVIVTSLICTYKQQ